MHTFLFELLSFNFRPDVFRQQWKRLRRPAKIRPPGKKVCTTQLSRYASGITEHACKLFPNARLKLQPTVVSTRHAVHRCLTKGQ